MLGNPISNIDPDGRKVETTIVDENDDGTYTVVDWVNDGSTDITLRDGTKVGESLTTHSFVNENDEAVVGAILNPNDQSGQDFMSDEINGGEMWMWSYMPSATGGAPLDFKTNDMPDGLTREERERFMYRGVAFNGKIASARDIGNFAAGAVAGANGLDWGTSRLGFDALQSWQESWFAVEGTPTQKAQKAGHDSTYPNYVEKRVNFISQNPYFIVGPKD